MPAFKLAILYVADPIGSATFFHDLLGKPPVEATATFAMLPLHDGVMLGLWQRDGVRPPVTAATGGHELCFMVGTGDELDATHRDWIKRGVTIVQAPEVMDFGRTFTATDPDGNRLRVFAPAAS